MLVLSSLHNLLAQVLAPGLRSAVLLMSTGDLISVASNPVRPKDDVRVLVALAMALWREMRGKDGRADGEFGRVAVFRVVENSDDACQEEGPSMLIALNSSDDVKWDELEIKGTTLAAHLGKRLSRFREFFYPTKAVPSTPASALSPAATRS